MVVQVKEHVELLAGVQQDQQVLRHQLGENGVVKFVLVDGDLSHLFLIEKFATELVPRVVLVMILILRQLFHLLEQG